MRRVSCACAWRPGVARNGRTVWRRGNATARILDALDHQATTRAVRQQSDGRRGRRNLGRAADQRFTQRLTIESDDQDELSAYFSERVSKVSIAPSSATRSVSIAATVVGVDEVVVFRSAISTGARFRQKEDFDGFFLQLPKAGQVKWTQGRREFVCDPGVGFIGRMHEGDIIDFSDQWQQLAMGIPYAQMARTLAHLLEQPVIKPLEFHATFDAGSRAATVLSALLQIPVEPVEGPFLSSSPFAAGHFAECVTGFILENFRHNYSEALSSAGHDIKPAYVRRAIDYMRSQAEHPLTLQDISAAAGISVRALHYGFKQFLGLSPFEYLRKIRLEAAYADLVNAPPGISIGEIARKWGFPNQGRFALLCKKSYGLMPSDIRRSAETRSGPQDV